MTRLRSHVAILCALCASVVGADEPDWHGYAGLLREHVVAGSIAGVALNLVDYDALAAAPEFAELVREVSEFPLARLSSRNETLAFYINAYNILALKMVIDHRPRRSIRDIGSLFRPVWKRVAGTLDGTAVTLDEIEHERLRTLNEPRMHFAIVCASVSCPDLRMEPYRAAELEAQLDEQVRAFLHNPGKGLNVSGERAQVSKIFRWFEEDFAAAGGIDAFIRRYYPLPASVRLRPTLDYNWSLNAR